MRAHRNVDAIMTLGFCGTAILIEPYRSLREMDAFIDSPNRLFESFYLSSVTPEIGIFFINPRTSYPR